MNAAVRSNSWDRVIYWKMQYCTRFISFAQA